MFPPYMNLILIISYSLFCSMSFRNYLGFKIHTDWASETNRDGKTICYKSPERLILALNIGIRITGWSADFLGLRIFAVSNWSLMQDFDW